MQCYIDKSVSRRLYKQLTVRATIVLLSGFVLASAQAAITWDSQGLTNNGSPAGSGTQWWFDPANWSGETPASIAAGPPYLLPPNNTNGSGAVTDTQVDFGTETLPGGEGVVFDPTNDPNFAAIAAHPADYPFPAGFGPQSINDLSISRAHSHTDSSGNTVLEPQLPNLLTIKGNLEMQASVVVGRSSAEVGKPGDGRINQLSGTVKVNTANLDIAGTDTSTTTAKTTYGNGVYDYRGGILEVQLVNQNGGIRLSPSSGTVGAGGVARFIQRNPGTPGYVRTYDFNVASGAGSTTLLANGTTNGVGIVEFHSAGTSGTRPIQVGRNLVINNGAVTSPAGAVRSSRLQLVLDAAPSIDANGVPQNLGLFDTDFDQTDIDPVLQSPIIGNDTTGSGDLGDFFSNADATAVYAQDSIVSAMFNGSTYKWKISYTGNITWTDANASTVASIAGTGGADVVLIGDSSIIVPQGVPGDYNNNGVVDAADYVVWRKNLGTNTTLPNEVTGTTPGQVTQEDYAAWRARFGNTSGAGSGLETAAVPEPHSIVMLISALIGSFFAARRRQPLARI
jgi:hypothetical protein